MIPFLVATFLSIIWWNKISTRSRLSKRAKMRGGRGYKTISRRRTFRTCGACHTFPLQEKNHNLIQQHESIDDDFPLI